MPSQRFAESLTEINTHFPRSLELRGHRAACPVFRAWAVSRRRGVKELGGTSRGKRGEGEGGTENLREEIGSARTPFHSRRTGGAEPESVGLGPPGHTREVNELLHLTSGFGVPSPTPTQKPPFLLKLTSTMSGSALHVPVPALCSGLCTALSFSAVPVAASRAARHTIRRCRKAGRRSRWKTFICLSI